MLAFYAFETRRRLTGDDTARPTGTGTLWENVRRPLERLGHGALSSARQSTLQSIAPTCAEVIFLVASHRRTP
jgi:hypothetical protein